jgi:hypothetical protein
MLITGEQAQKWILQRLHLKNDVTVTTPLDLPKQSIAYIKKPPGMAAGNDIFRHINNTIGF